MRAGPAGSETWWACALCFWNSLEGAQDKVRAELAVCREEGIFQCPEPQTGKGRTLEMAGEGTGKGEERRGIKLVVGTPGYGLQAGRESYGIGPRRSVKME